MLLISGFIPSLPSFPSPQCSGKGVLWLYCWLLPTATAGWWAQFIFQTALRSPADAESKAWHKERCLVLTFLSLYWSSEKDDAKLHNPSEQQMERLPIITSAKPREGGEVCSQHHCLMVTVHMSGAPRSPESSDCGCRRLGLLGHLWVKVLFCKKRALIRLEGRGDPTGTGMPDSFICLCRPLVPNLSWL